MTALAFGPQLIGQTEKALNALLLHILDGRLSEAEWVTLRLALQLETEVSSGAHLAAEVAARSSLSDARETVEALTTAGLLMAGRPTEAARTLVAELQAQIVALTGTLWAGLPEDEVAAASRVLVEVLERARALGASLAA